MALLVVGMASMKDGPDSLGSSQAYPAQFVAVVEGALVVLDAHDGSVVRTLAVGEYSPDMCCTDIGPISVAADGQNVYFERSAGQACDVNQIVTVPTGGGDGEIVTNGYSPEVSPDGRKLAYSTLSYPDQCPDVISFDLVVLDLETRAEQRWSLPPITEPYPLGWVTDTRLVISEIGGRNAIWSLDTSSAPSELGPVNSSPVVLPASSARPVGLTSSGHLVTWDRDTGQVRTSDPATGRSVADLFTLPTDVGLGRVDTDSAGTSMVMPIWLADEYEDSPPVLHRWTIGQEVPVALNPTGQSPVWLP
jgi:hypothetical protein